MTRFPQKAYGRCSLGHNPTPGTSTDINSSTQIGTDEEQPLFWSNYYQIHVCAIHLAEVEDIHQDRFDHERYVDEENFRQLAGFTKTIS